MRKNSIPHKSQTLCLINLLILFLFSSSARALSYTVEVSEAQLQEKIAAAMPIEKKKLFVKVIFSHPKIDLAVGDNQIGLYSQIDVVAPGGIQSTGQAKIKGALTYNPEQNTFYFNHPTIVNIQLHDIPDSFMASVKDIAQLIVSSKFPSIPIYTLQDNDLPQSLLKYTLKSIAIENRQLLIELGVF